MSTSYKQMQDFITGPSLWGQEKAYHTITTDNKYMAEIGLSVFTTGQLYNWMAQTNSRGEFVNLKLLDGVDSNGYSPLKPGESVENRVRPYMNLILGDTSTFCGADGYSKQYYFSPWKKSGKTGDYVTTPHVEWSDETYSFSDLIFSYYFDHDCKLKKNGDDYELEYYNVPDFANPVSAFIRMNNAARLSPLHNTGIRPLENWEKAAQNFILDIKTSQEKCVQWSTNIKFRLNLGVPTNQGDSCTKEECVSFRMYLYDSYIARTPTKNVAFNNIVIASTHIDQFGRVAKKDGTGEWSLLNANPNPSQGVVGQLALNYNQTEGKFESGTLQVIAVLTTDLPAAEQQSVDDIESKPIDSKASDGLLNPNNAWKPSIGYAIPISKQNGNPLQWAPQYAKEKGCRNNDTKKYQVLVQNMSKRSFIRGDTVVLNKIDGSWIVSSFGELAEQEVPQATAKNWSFTYLFMNYDGFFMDSLGSGFLTTAYESNFWNYYYNKNTVNAGSISIKKPRQVTSWDFMGINIGGMREKNALSSTIYGYRTDGTEWPDGEYGSYSAPFFGCVFPEGYNAAAKYNEYKQSPVLSTRFIAKNDNLTFFRPVNQGTNVFFNNNDNNNPDGNNKGIFFLEDASLRFLPADIALNASPDGVNGAPIQDQTWLYFLDPYYSSTSAPGTSFQEKVHKIFEEAEDGYQKRFAWMFRESGVDESAFDLQPNSSFRIQFRPLKAEIYGAFDNGGTIGTSGFGRFANEARQLILNNASPIYTGVLSRGNSDIVYLNNSFRYNRNLHQFVKFGDATENARFPQPNWDEGWMKFPIGSQYRPAGAFGVIGASCTITANNKINFKTDNIIGMRSWFGPNTGTWLLGPTPWYPSYGGAGNNYDSRQNTQLFVRIFHKWPKERTIFDPSTFAVLHFNGEDNLDYTEYINENLGDKVYSNSDITPVVNASRKNKLLPYEYIIYRTIGIDVGLAYYPGIMTPLDPTPENFSILIKQTGSGYSGTDEFIVAGGNGVSPRLLPQLGAGGTIIGFNINPLTISTYGNGYNYTQENFLPSGTNLTTVTSATLSIKPLNTTTGTGFDGYIVAGKIVDSPTLTDQKPPFLGDAFIRLTPTVNTGQNGGSATIVEPTTDSYETEVNIYDKSATNEYDLFFHFHNDISHTFISIYDGGPAPLENHVTLTITPT